MKFAYADPPYIGQAKRYYSHDPNCAEVDHKKLIERLVSDYPDGWALSLSSPTLRQILNYCPDDVRIGSWCKSFCAFKRGVRPAYAWEPVIYWRGRNPGNGYRHLPPEKNGKQTTPKDFIVEPITLKKGLVGAKPEKVCRWILSLLNAQPGDTVDDLFPGTGIMGRVAKELEITNADDGVLPVYSRQPVFSGGEPTEFYLT
jgi:DNA modification methylase